MNAFLTFVLTVVLIFFILRLLFPVILRLFIRRITGFNTHNHQPKGQKVAYKKGETTIISQGEGHSEVPNDFGDYIDYEEVKIN
jgi:hypothetical protein